MTAPATIPSQPTVNVVIGDALIPGPDFRISYGSRTTNGTVQASMTDIGRLGSKISTNVLQEEYGEIRGGMGRCALEGLFPTANLRPNVKGSLISAKLKDIMLLCGRDPAEVVAIDGTPLVTPFDYRVPISRAATGEISGWQMLIDVPGPYGQPRRILFFNAFFKLTKEMAFDMAQTEPTELEFEIVAGTDRGSKAAGNDPIGYVFDPNQTV